MATRPRQENRPADLPERRRSVASYRTYAAAESAVDHLGDEGFPVERVAIVGRDLRAVEQVTGRLDEWRAAGQGAASGAVIGGLFGWLFGIFGALDPLVAGALLALYGLLFGAILGGIVGFVAHLMTRGRRDFSSVTGIDAGRYDVEVDDAVADRAAELLR